ncbi:MAG: hypothetical protein KF787_04330 [Phycisphaeraceae bacterium]|nr:hypothetical protein [Phycisphaerae bacterium]MBX3391854.1 hypothetical protein [Phycisphaeraceae bacterium]HRJ49230.1 hypothetical protein [Phycisphaerales bacterium]
MTLSLGGVIRSFVNSGLCVACLAGTATVASGQEAAKEPVPPGANVFAPTNIEQELEQIRPGVLIKRRFDEFAQKTNIRLGLAHTMLFQQASGGPGRRRGASGDLDILAKWTAIGAGTKDTGILAFSSEYRYQIGDMPPGSLGSEIGTLVPTTNSFSERPIIVKELYWDQRLFEDRFRFALGRIDPENLFGSHRLQSANTFFLNKAFSGNVAVPYPGPGLTGAAQVKPTQWSFITAGITDANGKATVGNFEGFFDDDEFMYFVEGGLTPTLDGLGQGRYKLSLWHIDERDDAGKPSDVGFTLAMDQDLGESFLAFARYGHAEGDATGITDSVQGGVGIKDVLGKENLLGIAAAWTKPKDDEKRDEKVVELFQRFQATETTQITVGVEAIFDPSNAPDDDVICVFSARLRLSF